MINKTEIGNRLKEAREEKKITQSEVGNALGMNKSTIQRYENGLIDNIKLPVLEAIAKILNVNTDWLIGKSEIKYPKINDCIKDRKESIENEMLSNFNKLNEDGQKKALETVSDLTQIPKYQKRPEIKNIRLNNQTDDNEITLTVAARGGGVTTVKTTKEALDELTSLEPENDIDL